MKTNKSYTKRLKVTRKGKILSRKAGQNHFNSKESGQSKIAKGRTMSIKIKNKDKSRFLAQSF